MQEIGIEQPLTSEKTSVYSYSAEQAQVIRIYDLYRNCLVKSKYYGHRLKVFRGWNTTMDIFIALAASSAFTGHAIMKTPAGLNIVSSLLLVSAVIAVMRPIIRIGESIALYSKLYYAYTELFYRTESLKDDIRRDDALTKIHQQKASEISERYRDLELQADPAEDMKKMGKYQDEVDKTIPADGLWLPFYDDSEKTTDAASS